MACCQHRAFGIFFPRRLGSILLSVGSDFDIDHIPTGTPPTE